MDSWTTESYWLVRFFFQRGLGLIYLMAFLVAANQFRPLVGKDGLLPLDRYVDRLSFWRRPSLFQFACSNAVVGVAAWAGVGLSLVALFAGPYWLPEPYAIPASMALWFSLWALYQSFVNVGQLFYGFGWESMLLETGFLAIFLGAGPTEPPVVMIWLLNWLLFRNMFGAGLIKMRGDDCWRTLTCLDDHYETQPLPNPLSWYTHHLPDRFHRVETFGNHVVELAVPFLYFAPAPYAAIGGLATIGFQAWLMLTGNFAWLNALTIVQALATFSDGILEGVLAIESPVAGPPPTYLAGTALVVTGVVLLLSIRPLTNMLSPKQVMNTSFDPLHLVNAYGAFGSITKTRFQLVIEGTESEDPTEADWQAYEYKGQPVRPDERPSQWAPYHLRLDWQLWFAAMRPQPTLRQRWLFALLEALLTADAHTLSLLQHNPFSAGPPAKVRVLRYRYRYTTPQERADTGDWWHRERVGTYIPSVSLEDLRRRQHQPRGRFL